MLFDPLVGALPWFLLAVGTVAAVGCYVAGRLTWAVGILFVLASISRFTVPIAGSGLRLEQVAVVLIAAIILARARSDLYGLMRRARTSFGLAALYLAAHLASSAFIAPEPLESLKIAGWLGISMVAAAIAALIAFRVGVASLHALIPWVLVAAALQVAVAFVAVVSQLTLGTSWGVQSTDVLIGKAFGLSHEANLFGILIAIALPLVFVESPHAPRLSSRARYSLVIWLAAGLGLAYSRGPILAFAAAAAATVLIFVATSRMNWAGSLKASALPTIAHASMVLVVAVGMIQLQDAFARMGARETDNVVVVGVVPAPSLTPRPASKSPDAPSAPTEYVGTGDTMQLRLRNASQALREFPQSPIIGLGTDSYGQRHTELSCECPAHISNLTVATLYEAGLIGLFALGGLFTVTAVALWQLRAWPYAAAMIAMLIGFQVTDAFRFASNWILLGTILGAWASSGPALRSSPAMAGLRTRCAMWRGYRSRT